MEPSTDNEYLHVGDRVVAAQELIFKLQSKRPAIERYITLANRSVDESLINNFLAGIQTSINNLSNELNSRNSEPQGFKYFGKLKNI